MKLHIMKILLGLLVTIGLYCGWRYYQEIIKPEQQLNSADIQQKILFEQIKPSAPSEMQTADTVSPELSEIPETIPAETVPAPLLNANPLSAAEQVNPETVSWITIPDTNIDYPVAQCDNNDFYLHHGFDGTYNYELGCPFLDCRCEKNFQGFNSIVYAHHMTKQRMFADIALYKDSHFIENHSFGYLTTPEGQYRIQFFAYLNLPSDAPIYQIVTDTGQQEYLEYLFSSADYTYQISEQDLKQAENLHLLLLSTCTFEFEDARGILVGIIEQDEAPLYTEDSDNIPQNPDHNQ